MRQRTNDPPPHSNFDTKKEKKKKKFSIISRYIQELQRTQQKTYLFNEVDEPQTAGKGASLYGHSGDSIFVRLLLRNSKTMVDR